MPVNTAITIRKGTGSQWSSTNPVLASGEPGYDLSNNILKIGDGVSDWNSLKNVASSSGLISPASGQFQNLSIYAPSYYEGGIEINPAINSNGIHRIYFNGNNVSGSIEASEGDEVLNFSGPWLLNNIPISVSGHSHTASDITNFNSSVSGLFPANLITGVGTSGYLSRWNGANSLTSGVIFDNGTNVGIGISNPVTPLEINGALKFANCDTRIVRGDNGSISLSGVSASNLGHFGLYIDNRNTAGGRLYRLASHSDGTAGSFRIRDDSSGADRLTITNNGNIGIGTTTPSGQLHIVGNSYSQGDLYISRSTPAVPLTYNRLTVDSSDSFIIRGGDNQINLEGQGGRIRVLAFSQEVEIGNSFNAGTANQHIRFSPAATERMRLTSAGNLGIGITAPSGQLHVVGTGIVSSRLGVGTNSPSNQLHVIGTGLIASTTGLLPNALLDVYSTTSGEMVFNVEGTNGSLFSVIDNLSGSLMSVNNNAGLPVFEVFSDDRIIGGRFSQNDFVISSGGNIGIGKALPSVKLDVVGTVAVSGAFSATTKSFKINHPSKPGYVLEYGSLESPYHGVRLTGKDTVVNGVCIVSLPDYIKDLVLDDDSINIQITNYKHNKILYIQDIKIPHNTFTVCCDTNGLYDFFWTFTGLRKDIPQIVTEYLL